MNTHFIHPLADVQSNKIGKKTKIWQFSVVLPEATIGDNCNINAHCFIENDVVLGDNVTVKSGVYLWDGLRIETDVFIGPNATFANDKHPRSKQYPEEFQQTYIHQGASIGANATILPGLVVGKKAMIGAGAVVTKDVPANAIVTGNPAQIIGYINSKSQRINKVSSTIERTINILTKPDVTLIPLPVVKDMRGALSFGEHDKHLPFQVNRYFLVYNVPSKDIRGEHAHKACHQFLVCVKGACTVMVDNGDEAVEVDLTAPDIGLHIPPMVWGVQYKYSQDAVLLVLASDGYDPDDYIRDYDEFKAAVEK